MSVRWLWAGYDGWIMGRRHDGRMGGGMGRRGGGMRSVPATDLPSAIAV